MYMFVLINLMVDIGVLNAIKMVDYSFRSILLNIDI